MTLTEKKFPCVTDILELKMLQQDYNEIKKARLYAEQRRCRLRLAS